MKKILAVILVIGLGAAFALSGTTAYLTSHDADVNVMTTGNVKIAQHEYERATNTDGSYKTDTIDNQTSYVLQDFTQDKPLYPIVGDPSTGAAGWDTTTVRMTQVDSYGGMEVFAGKNAQDKFVTVENTGRTDAYVRTLVAFEVGDADADLIGSSYHNTWAKSNWSAKIEIDGVNYYVIEYNYNGGQLSDGTWRHKDGILPAGDTSYPSLSQVYLKSAATNEDMEALDGNDDGSLNILVLSQAVQTSGFGTAAAAFDAGFPKGDNNENVAKWFGGALADAATTTAAPNDKVLLNGVEYDSLAAAVAVAEGGDTITLLGSINISGTITINADITINGNVDGKTAMIGRAEGFTGTMLSVGAGASLTLENVIADGGAVWEGETDPTLGRGTTNSGITATGNIIAASNNSSIVLGEGAVLQNNVGAHAINLGTRIGAILTMKDGSKVINNQSDSGAIWGGGNITMDGGEISGNSSTGLAGAIRMVGKCNLTMNGGEICNNKAATDGGAIWGYGVNGNTSVYNFNGGKMSGNEAGGTGGAIYTGTYSVINISGDFEMCDNKATDSGAIRLTNHTSMNMTGGKVAGNTQTGESNAFNTWNNSISITGGTLADNFSYSGGLGLTVGKADIDGVIAFSLSTNHNTAYLAKDFNGFKFTVNESAANFAQFNFKPAADYTYTAGDEDKLICMNAGYETYWNTTTGTFKLKSI